MTDEQFKVVIEFLNTYRNQLDKIVSKLEEIRERQR